MKTTDIWEFVHGCYFAISNLLGWFIGGLDGTVSTLIALSIAAYLTEILSVIVKQKPFSKIDTKGVVKKVAVFITVGVANVVDMYLLGGDGILRSALVFFYSSNEVISLIDNLDEMNIPVPKILRDAAKAIKKKSGEDTDND